MSESQFWKLTVLICLTVKVSQESQKLIVKLKNILNLKLEIGQIFNVFDNF